MLRFHSVASSMVLHPIRTQISQALKEHADAPVEITSKRLTKGGFTLKLGANDHIPGNLNAIQYDIVSTENPDQSKWIAIAKIDFGVKGYKLLNQCN